MAAVEPVEREQTVAEVEVEVTEVITAPALEAVEVEVEVEVEVVLLVRLTFPKFILVQEVVRVEVPAEGEASFKVHRERVEG